MRELPEGAPNTLFEAFAHIAQLDKPSVDDLKVMVLIEAAGQELYEDMAAGVDNEEVRALFRRSGREELAHAHRVSKAIGEITGAEYTVPEASENPYLATPIPPKQVTREMVSGLIEAEYGGEDLYERWASNCDNEKAAALFRQNGKEESQHGDRLKTVLDLLPA